SKCALFAPSLTPAAGNRTLSCTSPRGTAMKSKLSAALGTALLSAVIIPGAPAIADNITTHQWFNATFEGVGSSVSGPGGIQMVNVSAVRRGYRKHHHRTHHDVIHDHYDTTRVPRGYRW